MTSVFMAKVGPRKRVEKRKRKRKSISFVVGYLFLSHNVFCSVYLFLYVYKMNTIDGACFFLFVICVFVFHDVLLHRSYSKLIVVVFIATKKKTVV